MDIHGLGQQKTNKAVLINILFYGTCIFLMVVILCYGFFVFKTSASTKKINSINLKLMAYATPSQKSSEKEVFLYKKKVEDFTKIINAHRISSNVFDFLEKNTLPNVWYTSLSISQTKNQVSLLGEAQDLQTLSNQVRIFEESKDYIANISLLNSQITGQNKAKFSLNFVLNPSIFFLKETTAEQ